jgi:hypothetical protein
MTRAIRNVAAATKRFREAETRPALASAFPVSAAVSLVTAAGKTLRPGTWVAGWPSSSPWAPLVSRHHNPSHTAAPCPRLCRSAITRNVLKRCVCVARVSRGTTSAHAAVDRTRSNRREGKNMLTAIRQTNGATVQGVCGRLSLTCSDCGSVEREMRRRIVAGGVIQFRYQCLACGRGVSNPVAKAVLNNSAAVPAWDEDLVVRSKELREQAHAADRAAWFREYGIYLQTPAWKAKRNLVLARSKYICEGCGVARAVQVHHRSYDHWQDPFLWELAAICLDCHERLHAHMKQSMQAAAAMAASLSIATSP